MNKPLLRFAFCFSLLILSIKASATDYYFSTEIGNDSRSTTEAQNPDTPWKTINKLNAIFSSLKPGDAIYFKRGDVFYGTIKATKSGSPGNPIKIDAYGSGAKPVITSFEKVTGWKSIGNGRYESTNSFSGFETNIVSIDGEIYEKGRFPNSDSSNGGYLTISSSSGNSSVTSNDLTTSSNFSGGEIVIRKNQWILDRHTINSHSGNRINYSGSGIYNPIEGFGFFIQNHLSTLDRFGEWYYDKSKKLNVYFGGINPNNHEVMVGTLANLFVKSYSIDHLLIQSIHFKGANEDAIYIGEGKDIVISNTDIEFSGINGITSLNIEDLQILNCHVNFSLNTGLNLRYGNDNAIIKDNIIENTFPFQGSIQNGDNNGNGISVSGLNVLIENNTVRQTGFNGIRFMGNDITIKNNLVQNFCELKNDCGGIYTYGGEKITNFSNRTIESNIIIDASATDNGTPFYGSPTHTPQASGIFLDDNVNGITVIKNTLANTQHAGIKISNTFNIEVKENIFYNSHIQALLGNSDRGANTRNVTFSNNVLFSKNLDQYSYRLNSFKDDIGSFGTFDNNYFARPLGDNHSIYLSYYRNNQKKLETKDLDSWKSDFKKDLSSTLFQQNEIKLFSFIKSIGGLLYDNLSFNKSIDDFSCNDCTQSWDAEGINNGSIKIQSPSYSSAKVVIGSVKKDKNYVVKFKAKSNEKGFLRVVLRYAGSPWEYISPSTAIELDDEVKEYSVLIKPYTDVEEPVIMFISDIGNWDYWIDDLEIKEADVELSDPDKIFLFEYNASTSTKSIALDGTFKDAKGKSYSGNIDIAPYSSVLLVRTSEASEPIKIAEQEVQIISPNTTKSYEEGDQIIIEAKITPDNSNVSKLEFYSGDQLIGSSSNQPYKINWKGGSEGEHQIKAVIINNNDTEIATSSPIVLKINAPILKEPNDNIGTSFELNVNIGANKAEVYEGKEFVPITSTIIQTETYNNRLVTNGSAGSIFNTITFNEDLDFRIPVPNGTYTLQTFHQEVHFGLNGVSGGQGKRVFDIIVENQIKYSNLDLYALNKNQKVILNHENIEITDGYLDLNLTATVNNAIISGFALIEKGAPEIISSEGAKYINVGGLIDTEYDGNLFVSDYSSIYHSESGASENKDASKDPLFQTIRFSENLIYKIPVNNGIYRVKTYHIENYFGISNQNGKTGSRVFDIFLQNNLVKNNLDLLATNGNKEITLTFDEIEVNNGELKIELKASANNASLSGLAIIPMSGFYGQEEGDTYYINVGSEIDTQYNGIDFVSDITGSLTPPGSSHYNVPESSSYQLYQSNRFGESLDYKFPVSNGEYTVITYHNENYFGEITDTSGPNNRVFDIYIESVKVKENIDLYLENSNQPVAFRFEKISVSDGILNLNLKSTINNALISGIAIFPSGKESLGSSNLRQLTTETETLSTLSEMRESGIQNTFENKLYPNPAVTSTTLELGKELGRFFITIHNFNGQLIDYFDSDSLVTSEGKYEIPVHNLKQGVYIITLSTEYKVVERMRLAVTP